MVFSTLQKSSHPILISVQESGLARCCLKKSCELFCTYPLDNLSPRMPWQFHIVKLFSIIADTDVQQFIFFFFRFPFLSAKGQGEKVGQQQWFFCYRIHRFVHNDTWVPANPCQHCVTDTSSCVVSSTCLLVRLREKIACKGNCESIHKQFDHCSLIL